MSLSVSILVYGPTRPALNRINQPRPDCWLLHIILVENMWSLRWQQQFCSFMFLSHLISGIHNPNAFLSFRYPGDTTHEVAYGWHLVKQVPLCITAWDVVHRLSNTKPLYLGMRLSVCAVYGAASIFIFCFWNQQHNDAIQSPLTQERKWHIRGSVVIPCILWVSDSRDEHFTGSDYLSRDGAFEMGPTTVLNTYALWGQKWICTMHAKHRWVSLWIQALLWPRFFVVWRSD